MNAPSRDELRRKFQEAAHNAQWYGWKRGALGIVDENGNRIVDAPSRPGWVWVRIFEGNDVTATIAINTTVRSVYGLKVRVGTTPDGQPIIKGLDEGVMVSEVGASAPALAVPDAVTRAPVDADRLMPGLVTIKKVSGAYTMSVYIHPLMFDYNGVLKSWGGGWLNLTSYVPDTAYTRRWVLVGLNPATSEPTAVAGDLVGIATTMQASQLAAINPGGMIALAGVNLPYGATSVNSMDMILDARLWLHATGLNIDNIMIDSDGATMIDADGKAMVET